MMTTATPPAAGLIHFAIHDANGASYAIVGRWGSATCSVSPFGDRCAVRLWVATHYPAAKEVPSCWAVARAS